MPDQLRCPSPADAYASQTALTVKGSPTSAISDITGPLPCNGSVPPRRLYLDASWLGRAAHLNCAQLLPITDRNQ